MPPAFTSPATGSLSAPAERFRLDARARLKTLSKGGYAKVGLALALATDPEVLILDEPTSGLDLFTRREFLASMVELAGDGRTILISSHAVAELERVASHAIFLAEGKLLLAGSLEELRRRLRRIRIQHDGRLDETIGLGTLLDLEVSRREWQGVLQDPDRSAIDALHQRTGVLEVEETQVTLEEMYTAILARFHQRTEPNGRAGAMYAERPRRPRKESGDVYHLFCTRSIASTARSG